MLPAQQPPTILLTVYCVLVMLASLAGGWLLPLAVHLTTRAVADGRELFVVPRSLMLGIAMPHFFAGSGCGPSVPGPLPIRSPAGLQKCPNSVQLHEYRTGLNRRNPLEIKGASGRDRTCDQRIRNPLLYPLSYGRFGRLQMAHYA